MQAGRARIDWLTRGIRRPGKLALCLALGLLLALLLGEIAARIALAADTEYSTDLRYRRDARALHCRDPESGILLLCPDVSIAFAHPGGFEYTISTDSRGERRVLHPGALIVPGKSKALWLIGDSIAMAFGNSDGQTATSLLAGMRPGLSVRNLGVDSVGACSIASLLADRLHKLPPDEPAPNWIVWIFNPSDYLDDLQPPGNSLLTRISDLLKRWLVLPDALRLLLNRRQASPGAAQANQGPQPYQTPAQANVPADHPTLRCASTIFATIQQHSPQIRPVLLVYPDIAPDGLGPLGPNDPLKTPIIAIARAAGVDIIDLQAYFDAVAQNPAQTDPLYLPDDGHPAPAAQRLFARALGRLVDSAGKPMQNRDQDTRL